jgi:23S rRNA pseudouridine1911/1915/1917 synthase
VRLDRALAARAEIGTRTLAERLLRADAVLVDGATRPKSHRLERGSVVEVQLPKAEPAVEPEPVTVPLVFEDAHLVVIDKPAGLAVHPGAGGTARTLLPQLLTLGAQGGDDPARPGVVHRLDRETSGLLVVARSEDAHSALQEAIRRREVDRWYLALVRGHPRSRTGRIDAPIGRDRRERTRRSLVTDEPREAVTHFELQELLPEHALLEVKLETGRTHQIRVHFAAIGHPVAGDPEYGTRGRHGLERQFLHASRLVFRHPGTGEELEFASELPEDLSAALERARDRPQMAR